MKRIFETCQPRDEVLAGELTDDLFAANLAQVARGTAPAVYQDPATFFRNTYLTEGLRQVAKEVFERLTGKGPGTPVLRLETPFGGGKTHTLIALYHLAKVGAEASKAPMEFHVTASLPGEPIPVASVVGHVLDPVNGTDHEGLRVYTLWGEIAYQLRGTQGYQLLQRSDQEATAPGQGILEELLGDAPALVMIDEIAHYFRRADPRLRGQVVAFLHTLFECAASRRGLVVVWTLAEDAYGAEKQEIVDSLRELRGVSARQERILVPTGEREYGPVVNCRLFQSIDKAAAQETANAYLDFYRRQAEKGVTLPSRCLEAAYGDSIERSYPLHPELLDLLNLKTSTIPNFQKTRGVLRLLARVVRYLWEQKEADAFLIHPHHVSPEAEGIVEELTSRLGRQEHRPVIEADIWSGSGARLAHAQAIDGEWKGTDRPPLAQRAARTTFLHSLTFGRAGEVDAGELNLALGIPGQDYDFVQQALQRLADTCWHLYTDGTRYSFRPEPQINKIIQDEMERIGRSQAKEAINDRIRSAYGAGPFEAVHSPDQPADVDDDADRPKLALIHYDAVQIPAGGREVPSLIRQIAEQAGTQGKFREYRNNLLFLAAGAEEIEPMITAARLFLALKYLTQQDRLRDFPPEQRERLRDKRSNADLGLRIAVVRAYRHLFYPDADAPPENAGLRHHILPIQDAADTERQQQDILVRVLRELGKVLRADDTPLSPVYLKEKAWPQNTTHMTTKDLQREVCRRRSLPILLSPDLLKRTIRKGVEEAVWVYYDGKKPCRQGDPSPLVTIDEDHSLYDLKTAEGLWPPSPPGGVVKETLCALCGQYPCVCGEPGRVVAAPPLTGEGTPAKAFEGLRDKCADAKVEALASLSITADSYQEMRRISLALGQLADLHLQVSLVEELLADAEDAHLKLNFNGAWNKARPVQQVTEAFSRQAKEMLLSAKFHLLFPEPVSPEGEEITRIRDVLGNMQVGDISIEAASPPPHGGQASSPQEG